MDRMSPEDRHKTMAAVKNRDTDIEMLLRRALWSRGHRYRVRTILIEHPDIVFPSKRLMFFSNAAFGTAVNVNPKGDHRANQNGTHPEHHARHWSPAPSGAGRDNSDISQPPAHATAASRGIGTAPR